MLQHLGLRGRNVDRPVAQGQVEAGEGEPTDDHAADQAEEELGDDLGAENPTEIDRLVPEHFGPEPSEGREPGGQQSEHHESGDEGAASRGGLVVTTARGDVRTST